METLTKTITAYITNSIPGFRKLNEHLFNPLIAGFLGFATFFNDHFLHASPFLYYSIKSENWYGLFRFSFSRIRVFPSNDKRSY